jgi:hypothetical protein
MERGQLHQDSMVAPRQYLAATQVSAFLVLYTLIFYENVSLFVDDPYCTYHMSKDKDYQKSFWTGPDEKVHSMSVKVLFYFCLHFSAAEVNGINKVASQVSRNHYVPSSYENDIGEGQVN